MYIVSVNIGIKFRVFPFGSIIKIEKNKSYYLRNVKSNRHSIIMNSLIKKIKGPTKNMCKMFASVGRE